MNVLSLFDGMSCGQIALNRSGVAYDRYFASEIDKHAIKVAMRSFPDTVQLGCVKQVSTSVLPKIDLLIGGSPCQSFSTSGSRAGFEGKSGLFWEYHRLLSELRQSNPDVLFMLENVVMKKEWQDVISSALGVEPIKISSALVSAQSRQRLYWTNIPGITQPEDRGVKLRDIVEESPDPSYALSEKAIAKIRRSVRGKRFLTRDDEKVGTIIAGYHKVPTDGMYLDFGFPRRITPLEYERLQTVPDGYTDCVSSTQRYRMVGNGWTVDVVAHIFSHISRT